VTLSAQLSPERKKNVDSMHDMLADGRTIRLFTLIDD
jgi:hypothetical protein